LKKVLACSATVVLTAVLATTALPASAATLPPTGVTLVRVTADPAAAGKAAQPGAGSTDGIRDEFAKLRCLLFRC
jgi:hypothetical protein